MSSIKRVLLIVVFGVTTLLSAIGQPLQSREYTEDHPLVYEDAWDLWPYVYLNEHGEPEGFNIDLLKELFHDLKIPYVIKLKPTREALLDLREGRSDLMLRLTDTFYANFARYGRETIQLFTHSMVSAKAQNLGVLSTKDLEDYQVMVHGGSLSHRLLGENGHESRVLPIDDMKEAIQKVSSEEKGIIVWNTMSLKWLMNKYQTHNLNIVPIDLPHGAYKFMSNDTVLLNKLDEAYSRLCSTERIQPIQNKWFYPEKMDTGIPAWVAYAVGASVLLVFLLLYFYIVLHIQKRNITRLSEKHNKRLALILRTTKIRVWLYNVHDKTVVWMDENGVLEQKTYRMSDYAAKSDLEAFRRAEEALNLIAEGKRESCEVEVTSISSGKRREFILTMSVFRYTKNGNPEIIVGMMDEQTERLQAQREAKDAMLRYESIFSTSMVDMTYYNQKGILTNINQKACETFHCNREEILAEAVSFSAALEDESLTPESFEGSYTTHLINASRKSGLSASLNFYDDIYYEQQLLPVYNDEQRLIGIFGSGRDVSEFVNSYHRLKESVGKLTSTAQDITDYINNINYVLHIGGVRLVNYSPNSHTLTIYREMNKVQLTLTQTRCLTFVDDSSKRMAVRLLNSMDTCDIDAVDADIKTTVRIAGGRKLSLQFRLLPIYNDKGKLENYFGLCRDISQEKAAEEELELEKAKAQEVENVKNVFLRNMSHEIRTPITTVVGFAELFVNDHDPKDEDGFIEEIKSNTSYLLKLVNDILFLSRLDAHMIEYKKLPIDITYTMEGHCQMGWAKIMKPGVKYVVENPYEHLVLNIDDANVGHIVEQIAENAARYTDKGIVKVRYDYIGEKLLITIADTGRGIDASKQSLVFERFANFGEGPKTGLGLPICRELAHQMGGEVYLNSAPDKGTTVWIVIPCEAVQIEKKLLSD